MKEKNELLKIVQSSDLTDQQKTLWEFSLKNIDDQTVSLFLEAILDDEKALEVLTFNLEGKYDNLT